MKLAGAAPNNVFFLFLLPLPRLNRRLPLAVCDWQETCYKNGLKFELFLIE